MILSDRDILKRIDAWDIGVRTENPNWKDQIHASSMDMRLWRFFKVYKHSRFPMLDPKNMKWNENLVDLIEVKNWDPFIVQPWEFVLWVTEEAIKLPNDLVARVEWRSSIWRLWLVIHSTAWFVDAWFEWTITLEIWNINRMPVAIYPWQRICQLAFEEMSSPALVPYWEKKCSKYQWQILPEESKIMIDPEFT